MKTWRLTSARRQLLHALTATLQAAVNHPATKGGLVRTPLAMPLLVALAEAENEEVCGADLQSLLRLSQPATSRAIARWVRFGVLATYRPSDGRKTAVTDLVDRYNEIVEEFETDPSLKIDLRR